MTSDVHDKKFGLVPAPAKPHADELQQVEKIKFRDLKPVCQLQVGASADALQGSPNGVKVKASLLVTGGKETGMASALAMGAVFAAGSFGRVRPAHDGAQKMALKELRLDSGMRLDRLAGKRPKTEYSPLPEVMNELSFMRAAFTQMQVHGIYLLQHRLFFSTPWMPHTMESLSEAGFQMRDDSSAARRALTASAMLQLGSQLQALHAHHVVHHDIKPANILAPADAPLRWVLGDFGLAEHNPTHFDFPEGQVGTLAYMSSEMLRDERYDYKTDTFSLGVSLAELLGENELFVSIHRVPARLMSTYISQLISERAEWHASRFGTPRVPATGKWVGHMNKVYAKAAQADAELADFIFDKMMHPDPSQRASSGHVADFAARYHKLSGAGLATHTETLLQDLQQQPTALSFAREFDFLQAMHAVGQPPAPPAPDAPAGAAMAAQAAAPASLAEPDAARVVEVPGQAHPAARVAPLAA